MHMARNLDPDEAYREMLTFGLTPLEPYPGSGNPWLCRHTCGRESSPRLSMARRGVAVCKYCGIERRAQKKKLSTSFALETMRQAGVEPLEPYKSTSTPWKSKCITCGEITSPSLANVKNGHAACKFCSHKALTPEKAVSIALASGAIPLEPYPGNYKAKWLCKCASCGLEVSPRLGDLSKGQGPCKDCGYKITAEANRLSPEEAVASMIDGGLEPLEPYSGSVETPWIAKCLNCGDICTPRLHSIRSGQGGCPRCGLLKGAEKNTRDSLEAESVMMESHLKPLVAYPGTRHPWKSMCLTCGIMSSPRLSAVLRGSKCSKCSRKEAGIKARVPTEIAIAEMVDAGFRPLEPFVTSTTAWRCKCDRCGHESAPRLAGIRDGKGCIYCSRVGRTPVSGKIVYLLYREDYISYKIGVGNQSRLTKHQARGRQIAWTWDAPTVQDAYKLERNVLVYVREVLLLPMHLSPELMPQGGFTETFSADSLNQPALIALIENLRD